MIGVFHLPWTMATRREEPGVDGKRGQLSSARLLAAMDLPSDFGAAPGPFIVAMLVYFVLGVVGMI